MHPMELWDHQRIYFPVAFGAEHSFSMDRRKCMLWSHRKKHLVSVACQTFGMKAKENNLPEGILLFNKWRL